MSTRHRIQSLISPSLQQPAHTHSLTRPTPSPQAFLHSLPTPKMKFSTVLAAAATAAAVPTQAGALGPRQGGTLVTAKLYTEYQGGTPTETLQLRAAGTTKFRAGGYARVCATTHKTGCAAYALVDGKPNLGADDNHPEAGSRAKPLFISPAPDFAYEICVSQQGHTELPDGTTRQDTWRVRGLRLDCPGRRALAARAPSPEAAPPSVERFGNTFFVHYDE